MEDVDLKRHPRGIRRAGNRVEQRALGGRHELVAMTVVRELEARVLGRLADAVEHVGRLQRVLARELVVLVIDPGADDPSSTKALRLVEGGGHAITQRAESGMRGPT